MMLESKEVEGFTEEELRHSGLPSESSQRWVYAIGLIGYMLTLLGIAASYGILGYVIIKGLFS